MTDKNNQPTPLTRYVDIRILAVWPIAITVIVIGNFTGDFRGLYPLTEAARYVSAGIIVVILAAFIAIAPALERYSEEEFDD
jgi:hypothetical protein